MPVAIYGGSFNPPHLGHEALINSIEALKCFNRIVIMPCYESLYQKKLVSFEHRIAMCKLVTMGKDNDFCQFIVSDWEKDNHSNATIDLMDRLVEKHIFGYEQPYFVIGQDNAENIQKWVRWEELINRHRFIIVSRNLKPKIDWYLRSPHLLIKMEDHFAEISSTKYRETKDVRLLNPSVTDYIKENKLY
jgi:nicotinate-nucleotide adenylyltransferase